MNAAPSPEPTLTGLTLVEVAEAIATKKTSAVEVTEACLAAIESAQPTLNCFVTIEPEAALAEARIRDAELARSGPRGPLHGVPLAHKDLLYRRGRPISCGSKVLANFVADETATALERYEAAGAIYLGGLNMAEIALGPAGRNEHVGHCRNPWNPAYITGGSSSGSGAALAARLVYGALGTDTGGSIRIPSAVCGVVGLKPTHGRVTRHGVMPLSTSLDNLGPMARTVPDCARLLQCLAGHDPRDPLSSIEPVPDYEAALATADVNGLRIAVPTDYFYDDADPAVAAALHASLEVYRGLGAEIVEIELGEQGLLRQLTAMLIRVEAASIHARWLRDQPELYSTEIRERLETGLYLPAVRYLEALRLRAPTSRAFCERVFAVADMLHLPGVAIATPSFEVLENAVSNDSPRINDRLAWCTRGANYLGLPALGVPCGFANGLPVGFQLMGPPFSELRLFAAGHAFQGATDWHMQAPNL